MNSSPHLIDTPVATAQAVPATQTLTQADVTTQALATVQPAISIIVPVYNAASCLFNCVDSLLQQDFTDFELILVNDASTDNTAELCRKAAATHAQVRYHNLSQNGGQGLARNAGMALAKGRYILFVDADDTLKAHSLRQLHHCAQSTDADVIVYGYSVTSSSSVQTYIPASHYSPRELLQDKNFFPSPWNKLFKRAFLELHGLQFPPSRSAEDVAFIFKTLTCQPRIASCCQLLYEYNFHVGNISHQLAKRSDTFISLLDIQTFLRQHGLYADYAPIFRKAIVDCALRHPMHLFLVASLWRGKNRAQNLRDFPLFMIRLLRFFYTLYTR